MAELEQKNIPGLISTHFRFVDSQFSRVFARLDDLERKVDGLDIKVDALPRIIAEMIAEDRKRS